MTRLHSLARVGSFDRVALTVDGVPLRDVYGAVCARRARKRANRRRRRQRIRRGWR